MSLSDAQIEKFQKLYKRQFRKELSKKEAYAKGVKLVRLMQLIYRPMTKEECEGIKKHTKNSNKNDQHSN